MYHQRHGRDDDEHHDGYGIEQDAQVYAQCLRERQPGHVVRHKGGESAIFKARGGEILPGSDIAQ